MTLAYSTHAPIYRSRSCTFEALPLFARGTVEIPNHPQLVRELKLLERRTSRSGCDSVDHPQNGSDDHANVLAGAMHIAAFKRKKRMGFMFSAPEINWS